MKIFDYFPFQSFRLHQKEILIELAENIESYDWFFLEAPTGFGKSAVAYTLTQWLLRTYGGLSHICVQNKFLQQQYLNDFKNLEQIKGRNNFACLLAEKEEPLTCDIGVCVLDQKILCPFKPKRVIVERPFSSGVALRDDHGIVLDWEGCIRKCLYWQQKDKGIRNDVTLHNYAYYFYEQNYVRDFSKRYLGVFDEGHTVENILMNFIGFKISDWVLEKVHLKGFPIPEYRDVNDWIDWLNRLEEELAKVKGELPPSRSIEELSKKERRVLVTYINLCKRVSELLSLLSEDKENWVTKTRRDKYSDKNMSVTFKPVTVKKYSNHIFGFTTKNLLMSATILDHEKLKRYLGIKDDVKFLRVEESTFPVKNRPFIQAYVGRATRKTINTYLPALITTLDSVYIPKKMNDKGVIHTHTNKIARHITTNSKYANIMITNTGVEESRETIIKQFFDAEPPKIMVSPSMNLGVDLKDDRCRWQLIVKIPYPDLSDPQIAKRLEIEPDWYDWVTLMTLIQTYGRGCRSDTDYCETYILDSMFMWLWKKNWKIAPKWFRDAITNMGEWKPPVKEEIKT